MLLSLALLAACNSTRDVSRAPLRIDQRLSRALAIDLRSDRDDPLELAHVAATSDSTLLAIEKRTGDLWLLPMSTGRARRVGSVNGAGRRRVLAMHADDALVSMIDVAGRISEDIAASPTPKIVARRPSGRLGNLLGFARLRDGSFLLMESAITLTSGQWMPADTISVTRLFRPDSQVILARWARGGPHDPLGVVSDFTAVTVSDDTAYVSGSAPPRAAVLPIEGETPPTFRSFDGIGAVQLSAADEARLEQELRRRGVPEREISLVPKSYPAIAAARRSAGVWFVSSPTSADRFRLMIACEGHSFHVSLAGADISDIRLLDSGVVIVRDLLEAGVVRVEYSRYRDFPASCET